VNVVVLNDARIWQQTESLWTPLLAVLLFALERISVVVTSEGALHWGLGKATK
jgi:hypothetical protein